MSNQPPSPYATLARFYDEAGLSNYAGLISPQIITFLQRSSWMGRRALILGCGTGASAAAIAEMNIDIFGIDSSPEMLAVARRLFERMDIHAQFELGDIRAHDYPDEIDLVYCIGNVLNEMGSLRELEIIFQKSYQALLPGKRFVFDLLSLRGLGQLLGEGEQTIDIFNRIFISIQNHFNFETLTLRQLLTCFWTEPNNPTAWQRENVHITLRGFPQAAVVKLLEKTGFIVVGTYDLNLELFNPNQDQDGRFIIMAEKPA